MSWLECVPNVSEGRDTATIAALAETFAGRADVHLLEHSSDSDHHRSVFTLAGRSQPLVAALFEFVSRAVERIDLKRQRGVHPRVGVVDVVPFVPLGRSPMSLAVAAAGQLGALVGERLDVPVFGYGEAATRGERRRLERVRRGGLDRLAERMESNAAWRPDWGPAVPHPTAGVTLIGARTLLIAFNVLLDTADVGIARRIARTVRESNGGLPTVKAIGVYLERRGCAQVSMNLTDYRRVAPAAALAAVRAEARRHGVAVASTERIGLLPAAAVAGVDPSGLRMENFGPEAVLETRLAELGIDLAAEDR